MSEVPQVPPKQPKWVALLGGKKFAAMVAGLVASVVVALVAAGAAKFGFPLSAEIVLVIETAISGKVIGLILGQSYVDAKTGGLTSTFSAGNQPLSLAEVQKEIES